jgi:hypothetical protein
MAVYLREYLPDGEAGAQRALSFWIKKVCDTAASGAFFSDFYD